MRAVPWIAAAAIALASAPLTASAQPAAGVDDELPLPPPVEEPPPMHLLASSAITGGAFLTLYGWVTLAWYVRTTDSNTFHLHDEGWFGRETYAGGADKLGHYWGNYAMTRGVSQVLRWGGWDRTGSSVVAGALSLAFFTFSEIKDGYKLEYGFSYGDMISNGVGALAGVAFELYPPLDRRIDIRISYLPSSAYLSRLRSDGPFNTPEDYTGQTFLVAYHLGSIDGLRERASWTRFIDLSLGYQAVNYKPEPEDGALRQQALFAGVSLNLQAMLDTLTTHGVVHFVSEMYQVPYTTLRIGQLDRTAPSLMPSP